jgi:hypothetical protein
MTSSQSIDDIEFPGTPQRILETDTETRREAEYFENSTLFIEDQDDGVQVQIRKYTCDPTEAEVDSEVDIKASFSELEPDRAGDVLSHVATSFLSNTLGLDYTSECFECDSEFQGYLHECPACGDDGIVPYDDTDDEPYLEIENPMNEEILRRYGEDSGPSID